jgi:hypothetical protein
MMISRQDSGPLETCFFKGIFCAHEKGWWGNIAHCSWALAITINLTEKIRLNLTNSIRWWLILSSKNLSINWFWFEDWIV